MRDWIATLAPASFRGVAFHIETHGAEGGRRIVTHEYVRAEFHDTEDMGRKASSWKVTAYVSGDNADALADGLFAACTTPGPAPLVLPAGSPGLVRCTSVRRQFSKDKLGWLALDLEFVEAGGGGQFVVALGDVLAAAAAVRFVASIAAALAPVAAPRASAVALAEALPGFAAALEPVAALGGSPGAAIAAARLDLAGIADPVAGAVRLAQGMRDAGATRATDVAAWEAVAVVLPLTVPFTMSPALTASRAAANAAASLLAGAALLEAGIAAAITPPPVRGAAFALRDRLVMAAEPRRDAIARLDRSDAFAAFGEGLAQAVAALDEAALAIAPEAEIVTARPMPSGVLAWRLYGDPSRAGELVSRTGTATPLLMPTRFIAPAPTV